MIANFRRISAVLAFAVVALWSGGATSSADAQTITPNPSKWYYDDMYNTCVDPCPTYVEGSCWCSKLPPIHIT